MTDVNKIMSFPIFIRIYKKKFKDKKKCYLKKLNLID